MALGCRIRRNFERPSKELVEAFRRIPVANIDDNCGKIAAVDSSIFPLNPKARLLGTAFTVNAPAGDNLLFHKALDMAQPGDVIVLANKGSRMELSLSTTAVVSLLLSRIWQMLWIVGRFMLLVLMLFLLSRSRGIIRFSRLKTASSLRISPGLLRLPDRGSWILRLIISRLFWMVIRLTELTNRFFFGVSISYVWCVRKGRLSRFLGWPSFSLCGGWKCGGWNEPYAGDVAAVRAGLRRRILLRLRKSAKNIETGSELASGSDSSPCLNNADPRSLSSITPPPQQPIPLPHPRLKIQPQRADNRSECTFCPVPKKHNI